MPISFTMPDYKNLTPAQIVDLYKTQDVQALEFSKIRRDLESGQVAEEDIQIVLNSIGLEKDKMLRSKEKSASGKQQIYIGLAFLIGTIAVTAVLWSRGFVSSISLILGGGAIIYLARGLKNRK